MIAVVYSEARWNVAVRYNPVHKNIKVTHTTASMKSRLV